MEQDEVILYAYAIMPNHYHLLVETPLGNVQKFMQRLNTAYGMYYRFRHNKPGHCFQGRYGAKLVKGDDYLIRLTRYIHLNPVKTKRYESSGKAEKLGHLNQYRWSSYRSYVGLEERKEWINYRWLRLMGRLTQKGNQAAYRKYIEEMVSKDDRFLAEAQGRSAYAVGDERFIEETEDEMKAVRLLKSDTGDIVWPEKPRKGLADVLPVVLDGLGLKKTDLKKHGRTLGEKKSMAIELLCQLSSVSQRELTSHFGYSVETSIGKQRKLLVQRFEKDPKARAKYEAVKKHILEKLNASC